MSTIAIINPGSGAVADTTEENAAANMPQLIADSGVEGATFERRALFDYAEGRYSFIVQKGDNRVEVQMPGLTLERVRYLGEPGQNIWHFPRLYIDGDSWVWLYAKNSLRRGLEPESDEE